MIVLLINFKLKFIWIIFLISLNIAEIQTTSNESNSNPFFEGNKQSNQSVNGRQANKFSELCLFWLVLIFQFKFVRWGTWSGDIYPIFHGGYVSNWYGDGVQEEYAYWHLEDIFLMDMDLYSNDDLLFTYQSQIQHNPLLSENLPLQNSILVKVDNKVSTTIWAKEIFDYSISVNLQINKSFLINDTAWSLFFTLLSGLNTPGIITKVDGDGNLIEIFYIPFNVAKSSANNYFFNVYDFYLFSDQSFITVASCTYNKGEFGVSEYSAADFWFFKIDSNRNFKWSTSIDFLNKFEERVSIFEYNNTLFVAIVTAKYYYWMLTLNKDTGVFNNWSWNYVYKLSTDSKYRMLTISYISERFIYGYGNSYYNINVYSFSLYLFDPITLKLKLAYTLNYWNKFFGFNFVELNSDSIYWVKNSNIYR